jgi:nucleotide-binding universal stress UspA family protein
MFKTVVWASDGSKDAQAALEVAKTMADVSGGRLIAVYVRQLVISRGGGVAVRYNHAEVQADLRRTVDELREDGLDASLTVVRTTRSNPARAIANAAIDAQADLIVLGSRGHSPTVSLLLGSVGQRLVRLAPCPVMSVPSPPIERDASQEVKRQLAA